LKERPIAVGKVGVCGNQREKKQTPNLEGGIHLLRPPSRNKTKHLGKRRKREKGHRERMPLLTVAGEWTEIWQRSSLCRETIAVKKNSAATQGSVLLYSHRRTDIEKNLGAWLLANKSQKIRKRRVWKGDKLASNDGAEVDPCG